MWCRQMDREQHWPRQEQSPLGWCACWLDDESQIGCSVCFHFSWLYYGKQTKLRRPHSMASQPVWLHASHGSWFAPSAGQILNFNEKFLVMNMIHIKWLAVNRVCAGLKVVLDLCSVISNMACNVRANKLRCELGTTESDLRSIRYQLNAMLHGLLETEKAFRGIKVMVKNRPYLTNANIRGLAGLWKSWRTEDWFATTWVTKEDIMQTTSNGNLNASPKPWC